MTILLLEQAIETLRSNKTVRIQIRTRFLSQEQAAELACVVARSTSLRILNLTDCNIVDETLATLLEGLKQCVSLQTLKLSFNGITDVGAEAVAELVRSRSVKWNALYMNGNSIRSRGAIAFAEAIKGKDCTVHVLDLGHNEIANTVAITALAESLPQSNIRELCLANTWIADDTLELLAEGIGNCPTIESLSISDNKCITERGMKSFMPCLQTHRALRLLFTTGTKATVRTRMSIRNHLALLHSPQATVMTAICSVSEVSRLKKNSPLRAVPKDLLRSLKLMLYG